MRNQVNKPIVAYLLLPYVFTVVDYASNVFVLIPFWKQSLKFKKCFYTCKAAAAVAQSSLVGCKNFRPSWDVKLVLLGPRHPFFSILFFLFLRSSICPFYSDFYVKTIGSPHLFVNVTHTIHWDSETFQWTLLENIGERWPFLKLDFPSYVYSNMYM